MGFKSERLYGGGTADSQTKVVGEIHFIVKRYDNSLVIVGLSSGARVFDLTVDYKNFSYEINYFKILVFTKDQLVYLDRTVAKESAYRSIYFSNVEIFFDLMQLALNSTEVRHIKDSLKLV